MPDSREKWKASFERFSGWNTLKQRRVQKREAQVIAAWLLSLRLPRYDILEVGCGNGHLGRIIADTLAAQRVSFSYHFSDLLPACIAKAKEEMRSAPYSEYVSFSVLDVYRADKVLGERSQSVIISTGFASAATYRDAVPAIARALKEDGVLICDFVNHLSPFVFLSQPFASVRALRRYINGVEGYHFGIHGIRRYFGSNGLGMVRSGVLRWRQNPLLCMFQKRTQ
ncbi:MAG TPA: methyltransferase domain-containing protein [Candidatus Paceibacterota bacterium]|jgi:SAM-dependent methyltransferase